jgi:hypothetical protein
LNDQASTGCRSSRPAASREPSRGLRLESSTRSPRFHSIDNLLVLNRFLLTTGEELTHYLTVRQQLAGVKIIFVFDELDHLGSYVKKTGLTCSTLTS